MSMASILDTIVADKRREIAAAKERIPLAEIERRLRDAPPLRDFLGSLRRGQGIGVIAEVKKASPSAGVIKLDFDPVAIARTYAEQGADCISVLTDEPHFQGRLSYLSAIRAAVPTPLLRKDFLLDPYQVVEARVAGADAVLLIAEILDDRMLQELTQRTHELGMHALVELYDAQNLPRVLSSGARLVGINNRDLRTFETSLERTIDLAPHVPKDRLLVSESGIRNADDVRRLRNAGARAVLVGETLMRSGDIGAKLRELRAS
jgi:indole-3-glycerol phosphate synthase